MAKVTNDKPLAKLTDASKENIAEMEAELDRAQGDLDALEELGIDTTRLKEQVAWGRRAVEKIKDRLT